MTTLWRHHQTYGQSLAIGTQSTGYFPASPEYPSNTGQPTGSGFVDMDYLAGADISVPRTRPKHSIAARMFEQYRDGIQPGDTTAFISAEQSGASGAVYTSLKKGTANYTTLMTRVGWFNTDAPASGEVAALHWIHGTSNLGTAQATYVGYLEELQFDFDADVKALTGQTTDVKMTMSQSWASGASSQYGPGLATLQKHREEPSLFRLAGPEYNLERNEASLPHLTGLGYYMLGEYRARALKPGFEPVIPIDIRINANVITATFSTSTQLAIDTTLQAEQVNYGFYYTDDGTPPAITNVAISGTNKVVVTLATTPTGANQKLGYAHYESGDASPAEGHRGNLRDSDTTVSGFDGTTRLYNWCCQFLDPIPYSSRNNRTGIVPGSIVGTGAGTLAGYTAP